MHILLTAAQRGWRTQPMQVQDDPDYEAIARAAGVYEADDDPEEPFFGPCLLWDDGAGTRRYLPGEWETACTDLDLLTDGAA